MNEERTTKIWEDYQHSRAYLDTMKLSTKLPAFVKYFEGEQWAPATEKTKGMPRPVVNIIKMICRNKKSAILSTPVKIVYKAENSTANVDKFNKFAGYIQKELGQERLDKDAIDDGVKKGTYVYHYYWDSEAIGKEGTKEGATRCEILEPLNTLFANPCERDEQKQKWIIIVSREDVDSVKAKADKGVDIDAIRGDESDSNYHTKEQEGGELVTVLTRYFRKNGEVYFEKGIRNLMINEARPLAPDIEGAMAALGLEEDAPNNNLPDNHEEEPLISDRVKAPYYPIVVGNYEKREGSIYGLGEVEGLIPNQKSINFNLAMALLNAQENAWGKYIVHPKALRGQKITNAPGQVLTDYSETMGGIKRMTEQGMSNAPLTLVETLTQLTRAVTGSSEVMSGEVLGSNMSGAAIAQLQSQAQQPIEDLKDSFWLAKEKQGKILAQFFKLYYEQKEFSYTEEVPQIDLKGNHIVDEQGNTVTKEKETVDIFNSTEYQNVEFSVVVEATSGTNASAAGDISALDTLYSKGAISLKTYLRVYPDDALSNKNELIRLVEEEEQGKINQLTKELELSKQQLGEALELLTAQKETVDNAMALMNENSMLKAALLKLRSEATTKINKGNEQIALANQKIQEVTNDATEFASVIAQNLR
ncbi:MAG: hypothetical protein IJ033_03825 [Clostridia bacterium]|nr:hypothetical protein [Clostridia bacterium]